MAEWARRIVVTQMNDLRFDILVYDDKGHIARSTTADDIDAVVQQVRAAFSRR